MPTSLRFYRTVLGFTVWGSCEPGDNYHWCGLRLHDAEVMPNTVYEAEYRPPAPDSAQVAAHEDTCLFFSCRDRDAAYRHLRADGVSLKEPSVVPYGMRQLWFRDPDGYGLCFQWPTTKEGQNRWAKGYGPESNAPGQLAQAGFPWRLSK